MTSRAWLFAGLGHALGATLQVGALALGLELFHTIFFGVSLFQ